MSFSLRDLAMIGASGRKFSPLDIPGCVLWYKSNGDVYNTGTTQATDGQTIETWKDMSGNGRDLTWVTGPKFTLETDYVNGQPALVGPSSDGFGEYAFPVPTLTAGTLFFVLKYDGNGSALLNMGGAGADASQTYYPYFGAGYVAFGTTIRKAFSDSGAAGSWLVGIVTASSTWKFYRNGVQKHTESNTFTTPFTTGNIIYCVKDGVNKNHLAEFGIYDTDLSTTGRETLEDYLGAEYGVTITH